MPEIYIPCKDEKYFVNSITVGQYRKYAQLMKINSSEKLSDALFFNQKIVQDVFDSRMSLEELGETDITEVMVAAKSIHFVMQNVITPKFLELMDDEPVEQIGMAPGEKAKDFRGTMKKLMTVRTGMRIQTNRKETCGRCAQTISTE